MDKNFFMLIVYFRKKFFYTIKFYDEYQVF